jgi:class 3 adenylate cyclase
LRHQPTRALRRRISTAGTSRIALHTGAAELRDDDYFGPPLNRLARILALGHGGQILLSLATEELVRDHLPPGATLRDQGMHQLKDLNYPEQIFQLVSAELPADFPPLRTFGTQPARSTPYTSQPNSPSRLPARTWSCARTSPSACARVPSASSR